MNRALLIVACCGGLALQGHAQADPAVGTEPSPMEVFSNQAGVHAVWSNDVTILESGNSRAVFTALVLADSANPVHRMRGVKVDLKSMDAHETIYLDEDATKRTRDALEEIANALAQTAGFGGWMGAREFWPLYGWAWNKYRELNADVCGAQPDATLVLSARGKRDTFGFPGETAGQAAAIFTAAMEQYAQH